ncbi:orotate phosphoribosyltransferase-like protein [Methanocaldococcus indicus]|uniref:orotate phosphoribosyltransferase-like protein n=1 Tax=Methanocaldococcus indicus TaxID=213231 RepID=UPI003C6D44E2
MDKELLNKVIELRKSGLSISQIADELNVSTDTARYLVLNAEKLLKEEKKKEKIDIYIDWRNIGSSANRLKYLSDIIVDILKDYDFDAVVGVSTSGVPLATFVANELNKNFTIYIPKKHLPNEESSGIVSNNFSDIYKKRVVIIDDVVTSGKTLEECVKNLKEICNPKLIVVLIDKSGLDEIAGVKLIPLIRIKALKIDEE